MMHHNTITAACLIAAMGLMTTACGSKDDGQQQMAQGPLPISTITIQPMDIELATEYPATLKGKTDIDVRPQVSGFITSVNVDEGQRVSKGQVLFTLDKVTFQAAVDQAAAAVAQAQSSIAAANVAVGNARVTLDQKKRLLDKGIISQYEYTLAANQLSSAQAQLNQAQAAKSQAEASLAAARKNMSYTVITSPSNGVVGQIPMREGSLVSPSSPQPLTTISDNSQMYAYFSIGEKEILAMTDNGARSLQTAIAQMPEVRFQMSDGTIYGLPGKVATVSGIIDPTTGSASVRALFNNPDGLLHSGNTGKIIVPDMQSAVIVVPQKATFEIQDKKYVFTVGDSSKAVQTPITILPKDNGQSYVVTEGLVAGQQVITEGIGTKVKDGIQVKPIPAK